MKSFGQDYFCGICGDTASVCSLQQPAQNAFWIPLFWVMDELLSSNFRSSAFIFRRLSSGKKENAECLQELCCSLYILRECQWAFPPNPLPQWKEHWEHMTHIVMYVWVNSASLVIVFCTYAALSNSQGDFILNGDFVVSMFKREIKVGNAVIEYSGSDNSVERINSTDRIEQEITLQVKYMLCIWTSLPSIVGLKRVGSDICCFTLLHFSSSQVLSVGNLYNPDVRYTFNIPIEDKPQQFYWNEHGPWQPCSKLCQGGCLGRVVSSWIHLGSEHCCQILLCSISLRFSPCGYSCFPCLLWRITSYKVLLGLRAGHLTPPPSQVSLTTWFAGEEAEAQKMRHFLRVATLLNAHSEPILMGVLQLSACVHPICNKPFLLCLVLNPLPVSDSDRKAHLNNS